MESVISAGYLPIVKFETSDASRKFILFVIICHISGNRSGRFIVIKMDSNHETLLVQSLGIKNLRHWECVAYGGGAGNAVVGHAAAAVAAGAAQPAVLPSPAEIAAAAQVEVHQQRQKHQSRHLKRAKAS